MPIDEMIKFKIFRVYYHVKLFFDFTHLSTSLHFSFLFLRRSDGLITLGRTRMAKIRQQNEFEYQQQQIQPYEKVLEKTKEVPLSDEPYFDKSVSHNVTVAENQTANLVCRPMNTGKKSVSTSKQQPFLLGYPPSPQGGTAKPYSNY